jgi:hypothetical protein
MDRAEIPKPTVLSSDYNVDGIVDAADYVVWRNGLGSIYTQSDYDAWRANFGLTADDVAALPSAESLSRAVPGPANLTLLFMGIVLMDFRRRVAVS